ncbi:MULTISPECIES: cytochrome c oxidase assembly factor CtaG [Sporosarcina]|uniref:cytochrome c oxidase assembly factor CtaG n=1 Tax=Sporosarcina TaxID=1569 RepID=UPI0005905623|nr:MULTISPECIES: cytochrome c oxidase assembly factor CtaG [Sporosarcina]WJY28844.1 cytochrome c oxidase assembly factor CtaG [Sporosarcina sp. 0.2-SM1T-5]
MPLSIFGFRALWSPYFFIFLAALTFLYFLLTKKWRSRFEGTEPVTNRQIITFLSAMVLLYIVKGSPMDLMGHILFSVHMSQMAILLLMIAPLFIIGIPNFLWKKVFSYPKIAKVIRFFTKPVISLLLFTLMFSLNHYPLVLDTIKLSLPLHTAFTLVLFASALFLWWPVFNTLPGEPKLHGLKKIGYVILSAIFLTPACSLIIFADVPVYETYNSGEAWLQAMALCVPAGTLSGLSISGPELFTSMPSVYDQQLGGIIMKVIQELLYVFIIGKVFFTWAQEEQDNADEITQRDLLERKKLSVHG